MRYRQQVVALGGIYQGSLVQRVFDLKEGEVAPEGAIQVPDDTPLCGHWTRVEEVSAPKPEGETE